MKTISLPNGLPLPVLGQGTWKMGEGERPAKEEVAALRLGIDLGMTLIDTAEMYGDGRSEEVVGLQHPRPARQEATFLGSFSGLLGPAE